MDTARGVAGLNNHAGATTEECDGHTRNLLHCGDRRDSVRVRVGASAEFWLANEKGRISKTIRAAKGPLLLAIALSVVGCGSSKVVTVTASASNTSSSSTATASSTDSNGVVVPSSTNTNGTDTNGTGTGTTSSTPSGPPACSTVDLQTAKTCDLSGTSIRIVHGSALLRLKTLKVHVASVHTTSNVSAGSGFSSTAKGIYLIVTLTVTNTSNSPQTFDDVSANQTSLNLNGTSYGEAFDAENTNDPNSFITNNNGIQPGESQTGDVIFDIPPRKAAEAMSGDRSGLFVGNFGDDLSQSLPSGIGFITLKGA